MAIAKCRGCGASIIWVKTEKGKSMPVDAKPVKGYQKAAGHFDFNYHLVDVHIPHWGTCPMANQFKKNKKRE